MLDSLTTVVSSEEDAGASFVKDSASSTCFLADTQRHFQQVVQINNDHIEFTKEMLRALLKGSLTMQSHKSQELTTQMVFHVIKGTSVKVGQSKTVPLSFVYELPDGTYLLLVYVLYFRGDSKKNCEVPALGKHQNCGLCLFYSSI